MSDESPIGRETLIPAETPGVEEQKPRFERGPSGFYAVPMSFSFKINDTVATASVMVNLPDASVLEDDKDGNTRAELYIDHVRSNKVAIPVSGIISRMKVVSFSRQDNRLTVGFACENVLDCQKLGAGHVEAMLVSMDYDSEIMEIYLPGEEYYVTLEVNASVATPPAPVSETE